MDFKISSKRIKLLLFSIFISLITYAFGLTNYSLSIDSETPISSTFVLDLGRWGINLVRFHIFNGHTPYFTLFLSLILLSLTAVELSKIFKLEKNLSYIFCLLFLTFPQISYQLIFTIQADAVSLGYLCSVVAMSLFLKSTETIFSFKSISFFILSSFMLMFALSNYQALIFVPIIIFLIRFFQNTYNRDFTIKNELRNSLYFSLFLLLSVLLYYSSVKIICLPVEGGYLSSYMSGDSTNQISNFYSLWIANLKGKMYYGEQTFIITTILSLLLVVKFIIDKNLFAYRLVALFLLLLLPFFISFFITNGYHPPRLYLTSGIVFAFIIIHTAKYINAEKITFSIIFILSLMNINYITQLFYSNYKIFNHDKELARKIDSTIHSKYPLFNSVSDYVYFYGGLPLEHHEKFRLPNSEVFGGSLFNWDNGSNSRIINFFKFNDIADYKILDNKESYLKIKDSINNMPVWPNHESIKMINNVMIIKLNNQKGSPLPSYIDFN